MIESISYFRNTTRDMLFTKMSIILGDSTYDRIVEIARKTDEILNSHKIIDLSAAPSIATNIEDAKKRWNSAVSDAVKDGRRVTSFLFLREMSGVPLQVFMRARESLSEEFKKIAGETHVWVTLTTDNQQFTRYGCFVTFPKG